MARQKVHLAAMEPASSLTVRRLKIPVITGNWYEVMDPNYMGNHPRWDVLSETGTLFEALKDLSEGITEISRAVGKDEKKVDIKLFNWFVRYICHYIVDGHSLGHIAQDTARLKSRLEFFGELIFNKKLLGVTLPVFNTFEEYKTSLIKSMRYMHYAYGQPSQSWGFLFSWEFRLMVREIAKFSAEYTVSLVKLSWDNA
jgi:hypothetical protein